MIMQRIALNIFLVDSKHKVIEKSECVVLEMLKVNFRGLDCWRRYLVKMYPINTTVCLEIFHLIEDVVKYCTTIYVKIKWWLAVTKK